MCINDVEQCLCTTAKRNSKPTIMLARNKTTLRELLCRQ